MIALPSDTATFLFTDIEGSTRRWETSPDAMRAALARHDSILRAAITEQGGTVFKTVGDAFCAVFADPAAALSAALTAQRTLAAEPWPTDVGELRVRMALHAGVADERDGDYFGPVLNRVARLLAAGHGGQVLVSLAVHEAVVGDGLVGGEGTVDQPATATNVAPGVTFLDLGEHRLKDLARPEHVFQVLAPGLAAEFPPILSLDTHPNNLPRQASSFVGREAELADLLVLLERQAVVTVVGVGGSGKTRLALQAAADALHRYRDGAWFVDLAPLRDEAQVIDAAAAILDPARDTAVAGMLLGGSTVGGDLDSQSRAVAARVRGRRLLLVLDNCEHLLAPCAALAAALARHAPGVTVLATSRAPLQIPDEVLWPIAPLATPDPAALAHDSDPVATVSQFDAVRLFIDRAGAVLPAFRITRANAAAVAEICHRLDGIPLAIELAAARVRVLTPSQLAERLDQRFRLLTGGSRTALPRQQTLRALIDWSYDLLQPGEQRALQSLSILVGAVPVEGALAVIGDGGSAVAAANGIEALDALEALVASSLVVAEDRDDGRWFRLLDTIRAYAAEQLGVAETGDPARERLLRWLLAVTPDEIGMVADRRQEEIANRLDPLTPNVRALARWAADRTGYSADATLLAARLWWIWGTPGLRRDDLAILTALVAGEEAVVSAGGADARRIAAHAFVLDRVTGVALGLGEMDMDHALASFRLAKVRLHDVGDRLHEAWAVQSEALVHRAKGDLNAALACMQEAVDLTRAAGGSAVNVAWQLNNVGFFQFERGNLDQAETVCREGLDLLEGGKEGPYYLLRGNIALVLAHRGETSVAMDIFREIIAGPHSFWTPDVFTHLAQAEATVGRAARTAALLGAARREYEEEETEPERTEEEALRLAERRSRAELPPAVWEADWRWGHALDRAARRAFALSDDDPDIDATAVAGSGADA